MEMIALRVGNLKLDSLQRKRNSMLLYMKRMFIIKAKMRKSMVFHQVIATKIFHINELSSLVQMRIRPLFIYVVNAIMVLTIQDLSKENILDLQGITTH